MSITLNSVDKIGNSLIEISLTAHNMTGYESRKISVKFKNENSSYFDNGLSITIKNPYGVSIGSLEFSFELQSGYFSNNTTWSIRLDYNGVPSNILSIYMPFEGTIPSDFMIPERPTQQTQSVYYNGIYMGEAGTCLPNSVVSSKHIQELRNGKEVLDYSVMWLYGKCGDGINEDSGTITQVLNATRDYGVPPYQVVANDMGVNGYPDIAFQKDAKRTYLNNNTPEINVFALPQKIKSWTGVATDYFDFGFYNQIISAIKEKTVFMVLAIDESFDVASSNGIVGGIRGNIRGYHAMVILGIKTIGGKKYWVCQNSWVSYEGVPLGDNGLYYVPFSYFTFDTCGIYGFYILEDDANAPVLPPLPNTLNPPYAKNIDEGFVTMAWDSLLGTNKYELKIRCEDGTIEIKSTTETELYLQIKYGYKYWFSVRATQGGKWTEYTKETQLVSAPMTPEIRRAYSTTSTNLIVGLKNEDLKGKYSGYAIRRHTYPYNNNVYDFKEITNTTSLAEWSGLTNGSKWYFTATAWVVVDNVKVWSLYRSPESLGVVGLMRPSKFYWDTPKIKGQPFKLMATEWNRLTKNCQDLLTYLKTLEQNVNAYSFTTAQQGQNFTATTYNEVRNCLMRGWGGLGEFGGDKYALKYATNRPTDSYYYMYGIEAEQLTLLQEAINSVV